MGKAVADYAVEKYGCELQQPTGMVCRCGCGVCVYVYVCAFACPVSGRECVSA